MRPAFVLATRVGPLERSLIGRGRADGISCLGPAGPVETSILELVASAVSGVTLRFVRGYLPGQAVEPDDDHLNVASPMEWLEELGSNERRGILNLGVIA